MLGWLLWRGERDGSLFDPPFDALFDPLVDPAPDPPFDAVFDPPFELIVWVWLDELARPTLQRSAADSMDWATTLGDSVRRRIAISA